MSITYKQLKTLEELKPCENVQEAVWGFNPLDTIPARFMLVVHKHGGFAMGAFDAYLELQQFIMDGLRNIPICWQCCRNIAIRTSALS
jgi:predicted GNAT superfamily acetyltransferase